MPWAFIPSSSIITQMHPDVKKSQREGAGILAQGWIGCWNVELGWVVVNSDRDLRSKSSPAVRVSKGGALIDKWVSVLAVRLVIEMMNRVERSDKLHRMTVTIPCNSVLWFFVHHGIYFRLPILKENYVKWCLKLQFASVLELLVVYIQKQPS